MVTRRQSLEDRVIKAKKDSGEIHEETFPLEAGEAEFRLEVTESIN